MFAGSEDSGCNRKVHFRFAGGREAKIRHMGERSHVANLIIVDWAKFVPKIKPSGDGCPRMPMLIKRHQR